MVLFCIFCAVLFAGGSTAAGQDLVETVWLDLHSPTNQISVPAVTENSLAANESYLVVVSGTFSIWPSLNAACQGEAEAAPQYPSPESDNGQVGVDAAFVFAAPIGSALCVNQLPFFKNDLEFNIDPQLQEAWFQPAVLNPELNDFHIYFYHVRGQNGPLSIRHTDFPTQDNYGMLRFDIFHLPCVARVTPQATLEIPCLGIQGDVTLYSAELSPVAESNPLLLKLTDVGLAKSAYELCRAEFAEGVLHIPCISIPNDQGIYAFDLELQPPPYPPIRFGIPVEP